MAESSQEGSTVIAEANGMRMSVPIPLFHGTSAEQRQLLPPANDFMCQQWSGWDEQVTGSFYAQNSSGGITNQPQWETNGQDLQTYGTAAKYSMAGWPSQPSEWPPYQYQELQPIQAPGSESTGQWATPVYSPQAHSPAAMSTPWLSSNTQPRSRFDPQSTQAITNAKTRKQSSTGSQSSSKKARVKASDSPSPVDSSVHGDDDKNSQDDDDIQQREIPTATVQGKKTYRVKNRAAAKRCREKTKQYEIELAAKEKQVTEERMYLDACVTALRNEVLTLKSQILQHGDCGCEMIQGYISRVASDVSAGALPNPVNSRPIS